MNYQLNNSSNKLDSYLEIKQFKSGYIFPAIIELSEYLGNWKLILICNNIIQNQKIFDHQNDIQLSFDINTYFISNQLK
jgi:hypothetical protein